MKASLIAYDLSNLDQYRKVLINRALFGYNDHSNKGSYTYKREGILKEIPHLRLLRGVVIVKPDGLKRLIKVFKKCNAIYYVFPIRINKSMLH